MCIVPISICVEDYFPFSNINHCLRKLLYNKINQLSRFALLTKQKLINFEFFESYMYIYNRNKYVNGIFISIVYRYSFE